MRWFLLAVVLVVAGVACLPVLFPSEVLGHAIEGRWPGAVRLLLKLGLDPNRNRYGRTPFLHALTLNDPATIDVLLEGGGRVDARPDGLSGEWPLDVAVAHGSPELIAKLLARGATPAAEKSEAFAIAVRDRSPDVAALLVPNLLEAPPAQRQERLGTAMLRLIEFRGSTDPAFGELFDLIIAAGLDPVAAREGTTLLVHALEKNEPSIAERLLRAGADPNVSGAGDEPALNLAISRGEETLSRMLLARGADPARRSESGWTALHEASRRGDVGLAELLLGAGAEVQALTKLGFSALDLAGSEPMRTFLLSKGGKPTDAFAAYVPAPGTKEIVCPVTGSAGRCSSCKGSGHDSKGKRCDSCRGSGKCSRCKGTGYVRVELH